MTLMTGGQVVSFLPLFCALGAAAGFMAIALLIFQKQEL